jgi:nucleoside-diphosphate-sugar epimerase
MGLAATLGRVRIFLAGATGVIGRRIVPLLREAGHDVAGTTRSEANVATLQALGAEPVVCDVFDAAALREAVTGFGPDLVMHQLSDLPDDAGRIRESGGANAHIRREGTRNLLAAAAAAGVDRFLAQSVAWTIPGDGGAAVAEMEQMVLAVDGVVFRYGQFYGAGTYHPSEAPPPPRIHIDAAAARTATLLDAQSGIVTITDA